MKLIAVLTAIVAMPLLASGAFAGSPDETIRLSPPPQYKVVDTSRIQAAVKLRPPPLKLPDFKGRTWKIQHTDRVWLAPQLKKSTQVIRFFDNPKYRWVLAPRKQKCWEVPWQRQCTMARAKLRLHHELAEIAEHRLFYELPLPNDWRTSVRIAQRVHPGTEGIVLSCSASEGSWGGWVPNRQGSGAGGWMQFMESTFWRMFGAAKADAEAKGFVVPKEAASWYSPLGQALAGAWGMLHGRSEWSGSGC